MAERIQRRSTQPTGQVEDAALTLGDRQSDAIDALLDEIDTVLEADAEEYVRGFVQKGGQ